MLYSKYLAPTLKEVPADAVVISHILMLRAGMIRKIAAGIYNYLPLALRSIRKIEAIIREEMNRANAIELLMPTVQPMELWEESGRWGYYGPELLRFKDRKDADFCLGPTHEEVITSLVKNEVRSYKELPINLYQIQTKFRDEIRPRFGLMRGREFIMKDAYSFDIDKENAIKSYNIMYETYRTIFTRCGLNFRAVEAGTGAIGGTLSHEFQVLAKNGEDAILSCSACDYAANIEKAECLEPADIPAAIETQLEIKEVDTPEKRTIEEVTEFLNVSADKACKTLVYLADEKPVVVLIRGDHELAETKLIAILKCDELVLADDDTILNLTGSPVGFAGPVGLKRDVPVYADNFLKGLCGGITGANKKDTHILNVYADRDFPEATAFYDLRLAEEKETCPRCKKGTYELHRGIEVGQVFFLGKKYSEKMNASVLDENGKTVTLTMGCYGIGVTRTMASAIEQNHDENGIIWPFPIAPFHVIICPIGKDEEIKKVSEKIYKELLENKIEVLLDNRGERPGVMFKDADLIGIPLRITIGNRNLAEGKCEIKLRREKDPELININEASVHVTEIIKKEIE